MIKAGGGAIVFVSTVNATITNPHFGLYGAAKGGVDASRAVSPWIMVAWGFAAMPLPRRVVGERGTSGWQKIHLRSKSRDCYPVGRYGAPRDIANVNLFLASDEAAFVTGIVLTADGG